jgi:hypothetical protein
LLSIAAAISSIAIRVQLAAKSAGACLDASADNRRILRSQTSSEDVIDTFPRCYQLLVGVHRLGLAMFQLMR